MSSCFESESGRLEQVLLLCGEVYVRAVAVESRHKHGLTAHKQNETDVKHYRHRQRYEYSINCVERADHSCPTLCQ